ncbi:hypothetical protein GGQ87_000877 [Brevundimonas alba]|uniref:Uncharacterized protein n=1 Tax=Brevundimonas alba TaxID=74314 RepID=A0A7X5YJ53_9CAUL|nr:hypothetical protein [Brevundimonas alba]NJC40619.1 hypothetical protein [Brevundimonas alba]
MHRLLTMKRLSVLFLASFAVLVGAVFAWQALVVAPGDRCERGGGWWDGDTKICARPISIAEVTGRAPGQSRAEASDAKNRELIEIEDRLAAAQAERNAEVERQRAALAGQ